MQKMSFDKASEKHSLTSMDELNLMITQGYGDTPQSKLPSDWRTRKNPRAKLDAVKAAMDLVDFPTEDSDGN